MKRAFFLIWLRWAVWVTLFSISGAMLIAFGMTLVLYLVKGAVPLEGEVLDALGSIARFWFGVSWSITLPLGTFLGMKQLFARCYSGYRLQLFTCNLERVEKVHYNHLVKAWRKWLFFTVWGVAVCVLVVTALQMAVQGQIDITLWFHSDTLYGFVMFSSWATLSLMVRRCPSMVLEQC